MFFADRRWADQQWANLVRSSLDDAFRPDNGIMPIPAAGQTGLGNVRSGTDCEIQPGSQDLCFLAPKPNRGRRRLSPSLSYGRHRGPARRDCRHAAVVITVYPHAKSGEACFALTRRPMTLSHHAGQVCLPGGRVEDDEDALQAAKREYQEELGVCLDKAVYLGRLSKIYVYASDNLVDTFVLLEKEPLPRWNPDPIEVDEIIEIPLSALETLGSCIARREQSATISQVNSTRRGKVVDGEGVFQYRFTYPALQLVDCDGHQQQVWGATAMILAGWSEILHRVGKLLD
ncbi:CoA pyrophosphatase [Stieleria sp. JC731]|uniref:NUDIX hydrolase n=1 Tax=Pirellulaceae TaxID=2691357 RepID=UPI001E330F56|nr:CoA pyrophosphatase [Stieleria sp. JC731]MCC9603883.1 CoA pyrophosphatase [Stieleria sp. JC731]